MKDKIKKMPVPRDLLAQFIECATLAGAGAFFKSLKSGTGFYYAFLNAFIAGLVMLAIGSVLDDMKIPQKTIFFISGLVGYFVIPVTDFTHRVIYAVARKIEQYIQE